MCREKQLVLDTRLPSVRRYQPSIFLFVLGVGFVQKDHYKLSSRLFSFSLSLFGFLSRLQDKVQTKFVF